MKYSLIALALGCGSMLSAQAVSGQQPGPQSNGQYNGGFNVGSENLFVRSSVEVEVEGPNGSAIGGAVYVTLLKSNGQVFMTVMAHGGKARFANVPKSELTAQVVASGYETSKKAFEVLDDTEVKVKIDLQAMADKEAAASDRGIAALNPKAQKDIGRALASVARKQIDRCTTEPGSGPARRTQQRRGGVPVWRAGIANERHDLSTVVLDAGA